jgi:sugar lactone lactonase YvrE
MTTPSAGSASREHFSDSPAFSLSSRRMQKTRMQKTRTNGRSGAVSSLMGWAAAGRRLRAWAAGVSLLVILLWFSPLAFSQACSTSCTGLCLQQTTCSGTATTSISGTVYAPNGTDPLPNVLVYVPNAPVADFTPGVACLTTGQPASGCPLVSTTTAVDGTFTLTNMPVGTNIPLVIQAGRWRTQTTISNVAACVNTPVSPTLTQTLTNLPQVRTGSTAACAMTNPPTCTAGDIPLIAIVTGDVDAAECVLRKMGVDDSEFTDPAVQGGTGRINFYYGSVNGGGARVDSSTPPEAALFLSNGVLGPVLNNYDMVMLPCQGNATDENAGEYTPRLLIGEYANSGGRIFATHYSYVWLFESQYYLVPNPFFANTVTWSPDQTFPVDQTAYINTGFPKGAQLAQWLQNIGASTTLGQIGINTLRLDQNGVLGSTQSWLTIYDLAAGDYGYGAFGASASMQMTFNTPVTATAANQCGRVLYNEYHVEEPLNNNDEGDIFPAECVAIAGPMTPQEHLLEFSLFDLSTFVSPDVPTLTVGITNNPATFLLGDAADTLTINVTNTSIMAANTSLTVTAVLPAGLMVDNMVGTNASTGWICTPSTLTCTRTTGLNGGVSDPITLTVAVAGTAPLGSGTLTVSATASGGGLASSVTGADAVSVQGILAVVATSAIGTYGQPLPPLTYTITGFVPPDTVTSATSGTPSEGTTASPTSTPGAYPIVIGQGSLTAANYTFVFFNGTLTLQQAASAVAVTSLDAGIYPKQSTTLTATVTVPGSGGPPTSELVSFMLGATTLGTGTLSYLDANDSTATLTLNGSQLVLGANSITAVYSGDTNYGGSTSTPAITVTLLNPQVNFGAVNVGTSATVQTLTYYFSSAATVSAVNILTAGASGLDYTDGGSSTCTAGTSYTAGQSCVVTVAFTPSAPGQRSGGVTLFVQGNTLPLMTWYLSGIGQSSAVTIDPGTQSTIATLSSSGQGYGSVIDGSGNVYVVDHANSQVIKLAAGSFTQTTVVSSGLNSPTAIAMDGAGNLYVSNTLNVVIVPNEQGTLNSADMSPVSISGLSSPSGLAVDGGGDLYVADAINGNVVELSDLGGAPITVASGLSSPQALAVDAGGNVYVAANNQVSEYPFGGVSPIPMGSGYTNPDGVAVDASGAVYVSDSGNSRIVRVAPGGASQATLALTGVSNPQSVALDGAANVYITAAGKVYELNRTTATLAFPSTNVDSTSASQTVTVSDAGTTQLAVSNIAIASNFTQVPSGGTDCTSSTQLSSAGQCLIAVEFAPTVSGALTGSLALTDNALNNSSSKQTVQLSGTALQVMQTITFPPIPTQTYGGAPYALNATASSLLAVSYAVTSGPATLSPSNTLMFTGVGPVTVQASQAGNVEFAAATPVSQTFTVNPANTTTKVSSSLNPSLYGQSVTFTATVVAVAPGGGTPAGTVQFMDGASPLGSGTPLSGGTAILATTSLAAGDSSITAVYSGLPDYSSSPSNTVLQVVNQAPAVTSTNAATFTVGTTGSFAVTATGFPAPTVTESGALPSGVTFAAGVLSGKPAAATGGIYMITFTASNGISPSAVQTFTLTVDQAPAITSKNTTTFSVGTPGSFTVTATGFPAPAFTESGALPSGVTFSGGVLSGTPASGSNQSYSITITATNVAGITTQSFTLVIATLHISTTSVNFGTLYLLEPAVQFVTVTNTGDTAIAISSIAITAPGNALGDYGDISSCTPFILSMPGTLGAGKSCTIAVGILPTVKIFSPTASTATLTITDTAALSPQSIALSATVINPQATLSVTSLSFPTQKVGTVSAAQTVKLTNTGNTPLTFGTLTTSGEFAIASTTTCVKGGTVAASASCVINVTFNPTSAGNQKGALTSTDNALIGIQGVTLSGQ